MRRVSATPSALRDTRKQIATLAQRVYEADAERDRYNRLYARGKLTGAEYDGYTNELDEKRGAAEEELARLADAHRHVEYLEEVPQLVEEYLRDLPDLVEATGPRSESTRPCCRSASLGLSLGQTARFQSTRLPPSASGITRPRRWRNYAKSASASGPSATARPTRCLGSRWSLTTM